MSKIREGRLRELMELELISHRVKAETGKTAQTAHSAMLRQSEEQRRSAFVIFDPDDCGSVPASDLPLLLRAMNISVDAETATSMVRKYDEECDGRITWAEFQQILADKAVPRNSEEEAKEAFTLMDREESGAITVEGLCAALEAADARVDPAEVAEVLKYCDLDSDGAVNLRDFLDVMKFVNEIEG